MPRTAFQLLTALALCCAGPAVAGETAGGGQAWSRPQLPSYRGRVERFILAPGGEVDGLLLVDGTEVETPPHLSDQVTGAIGPGDDVTVFGLKAANLPVIQAVVIRDGRTGRSVVDGGVPAEPDRAAAPPGPRARCEGRIRILLHGLRGEVNGLLLLDGTTIRITPRAVGDVPAALRPGSFVIAEGEGHTSSYGTVIRATSIGARIAPDTPGPPP